MSTLCRIGEESKKPHQTDLREEISPCWLPAEAASPRSLSLAFITTAVIIPPLKRIMKPLSQVWGCAIWCESPTGRVSESLKISQPPHSLRIKFSTAYEYRNVMSPLCLVFSGSQSFIEEIFCSVATSQRDN
ncbi:hypothetical protein Y032_0242g3434 [Ancylostoma ceylanicum]|uniref:Uncharacterized protein n=1 Tax=Ancylostoma ceylanicum TaxID=53326 RepID=A0A016SEC8_9BILA|nr:hypothetical protein Y032_0242g3434 [Ancylostoma ceylanicum]